MNNQQNVYVHLHIEWNRMELKKRPKKPAHQTYHLALIEYSWATLKRWVHANTPIPLNMFDVTYHFSTQSQTTKQREEKKNYSIFDFEWKKNSSRRSPIRFCLFSSVSQTTAAATPEWKKHYLDNLVRIRYNNTVWSRKRGSRKDEPVAYNVKKSEKKTQ